MEQNGIKNQNTIRVNSKPKNYGKIFAVLLTLTYLLVLGVFTYINHKSIENNKQVSSLFQKGMQIRNSYGDLPVTRTQATSYSNFPHRLLEIHADENTLYSYRDDFYKDYSEPDTHIDRNKIVIYLTQRQVFDNPSAVAERPECEAIVRIESHKRQPESYEREPAEINLKYQDKRDSNEKVYIYTPKLGHCEQVFSDNQLLTVLGNAISIRYSF